MDADHFVALAQAALMLVLLISAPAAIAALSIGLLVGVVQASTQVQDNTLAMVPKIAGVLVVVAVTGHWMIGHLIAFAEDLMTTLARVGQGG